MAKVIQGINDLTTTCRELLEEWDYEKNSKEGLFPNELSHGSTKDVWWKCSKCGYEWKARVSNRFHGKGCPVCGKQKVWAGHNDLKTLFPEVAKEFDIHKNNCDPCEVMPKSNKPLWWICPKGHHYKASPASRTNANSGCPYCSGRLAISGVNDLQTMYPDIALEWDYEKNETTPDKVLPSSGIHFYWKCDKGHSWQAPPYNRIKGSGCKICHGMHQTSLPEQAILFYLGKQYSVESRRKVKGKEIDIFLPDYNVGVEYDGLYYHNTEASEKREQQKNLFLAREGITLIRVKEDKERDEIVDQIIYYKLLPNYNALNTCIVSLIQVIEKITNTKYIHSIDFEKDRLLILSKYKLFNLSNSFVSSKPELLKEWDYEKNNGVKPEAFTSGSNEVFWWICSKGHSFQATISNRMHGSKCPYCNNRQVLKGFNDLQTKNPILASEWDYEKNGNTIPSEVIYNSGKQYYWKCYNCGNEWKASVYDRNHGSKCPICSAKALGLEKTIPQDNEDSLLVRFPEIVLEWDYDKNTITPDKVYPSSNKKRFWICEKGHSYQMTVNHKVSRRSGCPYCSGEKVLPGFNDLETLRPDIAVEWDYERNEYDPKDYTVHSNKKVSWKCPKCGKQYYALISNRTKKEGTGCPDCGRSKASSKRKKKIVNIETGEVFEGLCDAAKRYNGSHSTLSACLNGKCHTAFGFHWKYDGK